MFAVLAANAQLACAHEITATTPGLLFDAATDIRERITEELKYYFLGAQLFQAMPFAITNGAVNTYYSDGRKDMAFVLTPAAIEAKAGRLDVVITSSDSVIHDSRKERGERNRRLAELVRRYRNRDVTLRAVIGSSDAAVKDRDNELVHLYEIRDSLEKRFNGKDRVKSELGISGTKWDRLGRLANTEPLRKGRHRGKYAGSLRDVTRA